MVRFPAAAAALHALGPSASPFTCALTVASCSSVALSSALALQVPWCLPPVPWPVPQLTKSDVQKFVDCEQVVL